MLLFCYFFDFIALIFKQAARILNWCILQALLLQKISGFDDLEVKFWGEKSYNIWRCIGFKIERKISTPILLLFCYFFSFITLILEQLFQSSIFFRPCFCQEYWVFDDFKVKFWGEKAIFWGVLVQNWMFFSGQRVIFSIKKNKKLILLNSYLLRSHQTNLGLG